MENTLLICDATYQFPGSWLEQINKVTAGYVDLAPPAVVSTHARGPAVQTGSATQRKQVIKLQFLAKSLKAEEKVASNGGNGFSEYWRLERHHGVGVLE